MRVKKPLSTLSRTFASLQYPNYRLWFYGQIVSLFGTWMQNTAQGFLIYELTRSPAYLGYVGFASGAPSWFFMLIGGVVTDRVHIRKLLVITQSSMMVLAFTLALLTFTGIVQPWHIIVLAFLLGITNAFDAPARLAFAPELVDREDLTNAIALNATMFNTAAIVGPAAAGLIYALVGPAWCFAINGFSFIAVISALSLMHLPDWISKVRTSSAFSELKEGIRYVFSNRIIRNLIGLIGIEAMFGFSFVVLLPVWAVEVLGGDVRTNGLLNSARGLGALIGALTIASLGRFKYRGKLLTLGTLLFPLLLAAFSFARVIPVSMILIAGAGGALVLILNLANSLVQTHVTDNLRGRVMGIYSLVFFGSVPLGALLIGQLAEILNSPGAVLAGCIILFIFAVGMMIFSPKIRLLE